MQPEKFDGFNLIPFLGFLGFAYIFFTIGDPTKMIWEDPVNAADTEPTPPLCIKQGVKTPTSEIDWEPCK